jgi:4-amino-4-deoxy-L-arabinose transferase-like glycosyltransferase
MIARLKPILQHISLLFLIIITLYLRLTNLGYSDYVADEALALIRLAPGQTLLDFILSKPRGPLQYIITYLIGLFVHGYTNTFLTRLPFALAGALGIFTFYALLKRHYGGKTALYAALLLATNGLLVGLHRVVQYQPFTLLLSLLALYAFTLAIQEERWRYTGLYLGMASWALAILSHYDGVFIAPFAGYLLLAWYRQNAAAPARARLRSILVPGGIAALLVTLIYAPLVVGLLTNKQGYLMERLGGAVDSAPPAGSLAIFQLYNPLLAIYLYPLLGALSLVNFRRTLPVLLWFLFPWFVMELILSDPGTHIYTYIVPAAALAGLGLAELEDRLARLKPFLSRLAPVTLGMVVLFFAIVGHFLFVDHTPEYPRTARRILFWTSVEPTKDRRVWLYGFPYNRDWTAIGEYVTAHASRGYFATNEDKDIAGFYVPYTFDADQAGYYINIYKPQSFRDQLANDKIRYWMKNYKPVKVFQRQGLNIAEIYQMPPGTLDEIRETGY